MKEWLPALPLPALNRIPKWATVKANLKDDDIVIVVTLTSYKESGLLGVLFKFIQEDTTV